MCYDSARKIPIQIAKILLKFFQRVSLGQIVWELFEEAEPDDIVLPVDVSSHPHSVIVRVSRGSII